MVGNGQWEGNTDLKLLEMSFLTAPPLWQFAIGSGEFWWVGWLSALSGSCLL